MRISLKPSFSDIFEKLRRLSDVKIEGENDVSSGSKGRIIMEWCDGFFQHTSNRI